ncbi:MAG: biotin--[acetyl-CoA-carboxylase] ligase [Patescibacteria group bacterium]
MSSFDISGNKSQENKFFNLIFYMGKKPKQAELISDVPLQELEKLGFQIGASREVDSRLAALIRTNRKLLGYGLDANKREFGRRLIVLDSVPTTMDLVDDLAKAGQMNAGDALIALEQTKGLGQNGRSWVSKRGNLHANVLVAGTEEELRLSTVIAALAGNATVGSFGVKQSGIKWVNDILVKNGKGYDKIAGILTRVIPVNISSRLANIGIGLNLNTFPAAADLDQFVTGVTTLRKKTQQEFSLAEVTDVLLQHLAKQFLQVRLGNRQEIIHAYNDQLVGKYQPARLHDDSNGEVVSGKFFGVNDDGYARIATRRGLEEFFSGRLEIVQ